MFVVDRVMFKLDAKMLDWKNGFTVEQKYLDSIKRDKFPR